MMLLCADSVCNTPKSTPPARGVQPAVSPMMYITSKSSWQVTRGYFPNSKMWYTHHMSDAYEISGAGAAYYNLYQQHLQDGKHVSNMFAKEKRLLTVPNSASR
jgi:hypothetical protein